MDNRNLNNNPNMELLAPEHLANRFLDRETRNWVAKYDPFVGRAIAWLTHQLSRPSRREFARMVTRPFEVSHPADRRLVSKKLRWFPASGLQTARCKLRTFLGAITMFSALAASCVAAPVLSPARVESINGRSAGTGQASGTVQPPTDIPGPGRLFVGTCYQPVDRSPAQIKADIAIMKGAGFNVVRMGDLSWDSFEPSEGKFTFGWFDKVMDQCQANGIRVVLDIPGSPAPIWLHHKYPGVDVVNAEGNRVPPAERYMDDISDPDYVRLVKQLAVAMLRRYAHHPAVLAIGYDNEVGNGFMSYSGADRKRFIAWLKARYGTIDRLNKVWSTQRWSRHLNSFDEVDIPLQGGPGPSERYLDLHRFWSDVVIHRLNELESVRRQYMAKTPTLSNLWDTAGRRGFDYLSSYRNYATFGAMGFYPGGPIDGSFEVALTRAGLDTPLWLNEFTAGGGGWYGDPGRSRMLAYVSLIMGSQGIMAWTFNSHSGGEEQALFGLVDHDGKPSWKVAEWGQIASDFKLLSKYGFPRELRPKVAIAYAFDSAVASAPPGPSSTTKQYFKASYYDQVQNAFEPLYKKNVDAAVINIAYENLNKYKLVIIPALYVMDPESAKAIRDYVKNGGTVLMTGYSAKVNEHAQWFETTLPGRLNDVFGLRTAAFYRNDSGVQFDLQGTSFSSNAQYYEILEPSTARELGAITNSPFPEHAPILTENRFGKGHAFYLATESTPSALTPVLEYVKRAAGIQDGLETPPGVYARVVEGRTFYVNTNYQPVSIPIDGSRKGLLSGKTYQGTLTLGPKSADLIE
jgi:beta-galactosidase